MCAQRRVKSACASAWRNFALVAICPVKILIRLRECAGWSGSSLGEHVLRHVSTRYGSFRSNIIAKFSESFHESTCLNVCTFFSQMVRTGGIPQWAKLKPHNTCQMHNKHKKNHCRGNVSLAILLYAQRLTFVRKQEINLFWAQLFKANDVVS